MAAQVEVQTGEVGGTGAGGRLHLSPLTDASNKNVIEMPSIELESNKPAPNPKPRLTPKPFAVEKNPTIKPILAPKPRPEPTRISGSKPDLPNTPKPAWSGTTSVKNESGESKEGSMTRAKSMEFLAAIGQDEEAKTKSPPEAAVQLRTQPRKPRPFSAIFPAAPAKTETPVPAPRWVARRPLSADLTSKFESIGLSLHQKSPKANTPPDQDQEQEKTPPSATSDSADGDADQTHSKQKAEETAAKDGEDVKPVASIKSRISLLLDASSSPGAAADPVQPVPEAESSVGVKQLIKQLTVDTTPSPIPAVKPVLKPRPLPLDLTKKNPSLEEAFGQISPTQEKFDELMQRNTVPSMEISSQMEEQTKADVMELKKTKEQQERERHLAKMNEHEEQAQVDFERMKELERQRDFERQRQKVFEKEKRELEEERHRQKLEMEKQKRQELERERQRQLQKEQERQKEMEREREKEKQKEMEMQSLREKAEKEAEKSRQMALEQEMLKIKELEKRAKQKEREMEMERKRELEKQRQREMEKEKRQQDLERQQLEKERLRKEQENERKRKEELEKLKEMERQQLVELEKQRSRERAEKEAERLRQMALEQESLRIRELEKEKERQRELEIQMEKEKELEKQRQKQLDMEREQKRREEYERLREKEEKEAEKLRQMALEQEVLKIKELEKERAKQRGLEIDRQMEIETREREKRRQREVEKEKQRQLDLERQQFEHERLRREQEKDRQRKELEIEKHKAKEKLEKAEAEKMRHIAKQQELERQRLKEKQKKEEQERLWLESSALRPKVLDLDSVLRSDLLSPASPQHGDASPRWREPYKPVILDIDSFTSHAQGSPSKDSLPASGITGLDAEFGVWLQPTPERDVSWKVPAQTSAGFSSPVWTMSPQDPWELRPVEMSVDKPVMEPKRASNKLSPEQLLLKPEERHPSPQRHRPAFLDEPPFLSPLSGKEQQSRNSLYELSHSSLGEQIWIPREPQPPKERRDAHGHRRSHGSQVRETNLIRQ
uniref:Tankyrase 1-binding protein C-terminal domain-containing protein n=1 Tax=Xiphophorus couchianus TaxID=32473 RepID=A0A3B5LHQ9_9TELE